MVEPRAIAPLRRNRRVVVRSTRQSTRVSVTSEARSIKPISPSTKKLSILIPSLVERASKLDRLLDLLNRQIKTNDVEILTEVDDRVLPSGAKRNRLLAAARGEYVAFIDDDDLVSEDYVSCLLKPMDSRPDVITFDMVMYRDGKPFRQRLGLHHEDDHDKQLPVVNMTVNHLCAWRRSIATLVRFPDWLGYGDDQAWYKPLVASGVAQKEHHIDRDLYFYYFSFQTTANQTGQRMMQSGLWSHGGVKCYWYKKQIVITRNPCGQPNANNETVLVYDNSGKEFHVKRDELQLFVTYQIY